MAQTATRNTTTQNVVNQNAATQNKAYLIHSLQSSQITFLLSPFGNGPRGALRPKCDCCVLTSLKNWTEEEKHTRDPPNLSKHCVGESTFLHRNSHKCSYMVRHGQAGSRSTLPSLRHLFSESQFHFSASENRNSGVYRSAGGREGQRKSVIGETELSLQERSLNRNKRLHTHSVVR